MGKKVPIEDMSFAQLLKTIRTGGKEKDKAAKELLFRLTGKKEWTHQQCENFYESVLRHYVDDEYDLELLLAVSGLLCGYRSIRTATARRNKYLKYLEECKPGSKYDGMDPDNTLRKEEDTQLSVVAEKLQNDFGCGNIPRLIEEWIPDLANEPPPEQNSPPPPEPAPFPPPQPPSSVYYSNDTTNNINVNVHKQSRIDIRLCWVTVSIGVGVVLLLLGLFFHFRFPSTKASEDTTILIPGEIYQLNVFISSDVAADTLLEYISSDPSLVSVSKDGFLLAHAGAPGEVSRSAEITIQGEGIAPITQSVQVDFSRGSYDAPVEDINDFVPDFSVGQQIRLAGTTEWQDSIEAEVGDIVEIQVEYKNLGAAAQNDVTLRDVLPTNLAYLPGTTILYNSNHPEGSTISEDNIARNGLNIGSYSPEANAYVRFSAKVVDATLAGGSNTLVNWSRVTVNGVLLQDYIAITVIK